MALPSRGGAAEITPPEAVSPETVKQQEEANVEGKCKLV